MTENYVFPRGFVWGAATSAYQIEGAWDKDGKGPSIWDTFAHTPGKIDGGDTGDIAIDHYHRYQEDVQLAKQLDLTAYRFSVSWPRIFPAGKGQINQRGLDFYDRLVDSMVALGIEPYITLYHYDLPQALEDKGGWTNRDTAGYFADYAACLVHKLGDRVNKWITINEPWCIATYSYESGIQAPGLKEEKTKLVVGHHLLIAHGMAMQAIRSIDRQAEVGIALFQFPCEPESNDPKDIEAAENYWEKHNRWFLDPLLRGCYPPALYKLFGEDAFPVKANDFAIISQSNDFIGINYYYRQVINARGVVKKIPGAEYTEMGWEINSSAMRSLLNKINHDYRVPPIFIMENGCALSDHLDADGHVHDHKRIKFIHDHLVALLQAMRDGVKVRGYFAWSLFDNFEWQMGMSKRFGLIYIDHSTLKRYIKDSGYWYARVVHRNEVHK